MRSDTRARPTAPVDAGRDPARAAALQRLAAASVLTQAVTADPTQAVASQPTQAVTADPLAADVSPVPPSSPHPSPQSAVPPASWAAADPDGQRPERVVPSEPDLTAWADPPWWRRIRWAPDRLAGVTLVVLVVALGAFSVHRLLSTVPEGAPVPELPLATPGVTVTAGDAPSSEATDTSSPQPADQAVEDELVVVAVVGMVGRSGLVTLAPGARVADALDHAGGVLDGGDRDGLNLARKVVDGEQILVGVAPGPDGPQGPRSDIVGPGPEPSEPPGAAAGGGVAPGPGDQAGAGGLVDLNAADAAALEALPGVGPVTAASILSWRAANGSFSSVDQLVEVNGVGPATLARLRPLVTV